MLVIIADLHNIQNTHKSSLQSMHLAKNKTDKDKHKVSIIDHNAYLLLLMAARSPVLLGV